MKNLVIESVTIHRSEKNENKTERTMLCALTWNIYEILVNFNKRKFEYQNKLREESNKVGTYCRNGAQSFFRYHLLSIMASVSSSSLQTQFAL